MNNFNPAYLPKLLSLCCGGESFNILFWAVLDYKHPIYIQHLNLKNCWSSGSSTSRPFTPAYTVFNVSFLNFSSRIFTYLSRAPVDGQVWKQFIEIDALLVLNQKCSWGTKLYLFAQLLCNIKASTNIKPKCKTLNHSVYCIE